MARSADLDLAEDTRRDLEEVAKSRTEPKQRVERARILLGYANGEPIARIAARVGSSRPRVYATIAKAREFGALAALDDFAGDRGRPGRISGEARTWVVELACQKPTSFGYPHELWTRALLAEHIRKHCIREGHPSLANVSAGTVTKILLKHKLRPHKVRYYVEQRDPDFERKKVDVLHFYRDVQMLREKGATADAVMTAYLSYDEKPGIQALGTTGQEKPPRPGEHADWLRDYEYVRHGTLSLMAGIDLLTGQIIAHVVQRHRSREFVEWLQRVDQFYPERVRIRVLLDNHSAHTSVETRSYLATVPGRFEFVFTPKHGSWLNLIENFFAKLAKTILRGIRVSSREELRERLVGAIQWLNDEPVVFKWNWGLDELPV